MPRKLRRSLPWMVFLLAFLVRFAYLLEYRQSPMFYVPLWDASDYHDMALALSRGELPSALAFRPPLYPLFLAVMYALFGSGAVLPRVAQILLGAWSCVLVMRLAERIWNGAKDADGGYAGAVAGVLAALAGLTIYFDLELLPVTLSVFLMLWGMQSLLDLMDGGNRVLRAGIPFGLAALATPTLAVLIPFGAVAVWAARRELWQTGRYLAGGLLPVAVSLLLHLAAGYGPVAISAQGGVNFYIGNNRHADGITAGLPGVGAGWSWEQMVASAEVETGKELSPAQVDRIYYRKSLSEIAASPGRWLGLMMRKARLFWTRVQISNNRDLYYHASRFRVLGALFWLGFPLVLPFALAGGVLGWQRRSVKVVLLTCAVYFASVLPFFVNARYRHPLTFLLCILAGGFIVGVAELRKRGRSADIKRWGAALLAAICGWALTLSTPEGVNTRSWDYGLFTEGAALQKLGRLEEAASFYQRALGVNSRAPFANLRLAELASRQGRLEEAVGYYQRELAIRPYYAKGWNDLGVALSQLGREDEALECYLRALGYQPGLGEAARNAARVWGMRALKSAENGDVQGAQEQLREGLRVDPDNPWLKLELERILSGQD